MKLLPARLPQGRPGRAELVAWRLGRNLAPLFAVDLPSSNDAATWVCDFDTLTLAELARGAPLPARVKGSHGEVPADSKELPAGQWKLVGRAMVRGTGPGGSSAEPREIAPATLNRYGPDRKAAATLVGADMLLRPCLPAMNEVIRTLGVRERGGKVAPQMRLAIWASLVQELYRSQPALFAAAVQARFIQRGLTTGWRPTVAQGIPVARCEFGSPDVSVWKVASPEQAPRTLAVLDRSLREFIAPTLADAASDANQRYLVDDLVGRWTRYLLQSEDSGLAWVVDDGHQRRDVEVFQPLSGPLNALLDEVVPSMPAVDLTGATDDHGEPQWASLLPRVPGEGELRKLPQDDARLILWVLFQVHRLLRDSHRYGVWALKRAVTEDLGRAVQLSRAILGEHDAITQIGINRWAAARYFDERWADADAAQAAVEQVRASVRWAIDAPASRIGSGLRAEMLMQSASPLTEWLADAQVLGHAELQAHVLAEIEALWECVFHDLQVDPETELSATGTAFSPALQAVAPLLHGYAAALSWSQLPSRRALGLRVQEDLVIRVRKRVSEFRHSDTALGRARHQAIAAILRMVRAGDLSEAERRELAHRAAEHGRELASMRHAQLLWNGTRPIRTPQDVDTLTSICGARILAVENGIAPMSSCECVEQVLRLAGVAVNFDPATERPMCGHQGMLANLFARLGELSQRSAEGQPS